MQISKDDGPREKLRWENEEGEWLKVHAVEVKDKILPPEKIDPKTNKTIEVPCVDKKADPKKPILKNETTAVCPGKGGNHTDHKEFCSLADDSLLLSNRSGVSLVKGSGHFDSYN